MIVLDRISDFNNVIQFYERCIEILRKLRPKIKIEELKNELSSFPDELVIPYVRAMISTETLRIVQVEEMFSSYKIGNKKIDEIFENQEVLKNIEAMNGGDEKYKIRQLRNSLAHSLYEIRIDDKSENELKISIYINNGKIKGLIDYEDFLKIAQKYTDLFNQFNQYKNIGLLSYDANNLNIPDEKKAITKFVRSIKIANQGLSEERIATLKKWIKKIGINNFKLPKESGEKQMSEQGKLNLLLTNLINSTAKGDDDLRVFETSQLNYDSLFYSFLAIQAPLYWRETFKIEDAEDEKKIKDKIVGTYSKDMGNVQRMLGVQNDERKRQAYEKIKSEKIESIENAEGIDYKKAIEGSFDIMVIRKPSIYAQVIISQANYIFNYVREINRNREEKIFDYFGIDLSEVNITHKEPYETLETSINLRERYNRAGKSKKEEIGKAIEKYGEEVKNSANFFRHLRDSIAHCWYTVDYNRYYNTRNIDEIMFTFQTYSEETRDKDFEIQVSAKELLKLIKSIRLKVKDSIESSNEGKQLEESYLKEALVYRGIDTTDLLDERENNLNNFEVKNKGEDRDE